MKTGTSMTIKWIKTSGWSNKSPSKCAQKTLNKAKEETEKKEKRTEEKLTGKTWLY